MPLLPERWARLQEIPKRTEYDGVKVCSPRYLSLPGLQALPLNTLSCRCAVPRTVDHLLDSFHPDIIHAHVAIPDGYTSVALSKQFDVPLVTSIHGADFYSSADVLGCRPLIQSTIDASHTLHLNSSILAAEGIEKGIALGHHEVIPNGVNIDQIDDARDASISFDLSSDDIIVVTLANLIPRKGHKTVMNAISELNDPITYLIVGNGPYRNELERYADEIGISGQVIFTGYVEEQRDVFGMLWRSDIFALPSHDEAFGVAYLEAMACELPVIARSGEGPEDFITDGSSGYLLPEDDEGSELAERIHRLIDNPTERQEMGLAGRKIVETEYTWQSNAKQMESVYRGAIDDDR